VCNSDDVMLGVESPSGMRVSVQRSANGVKLFGYGDPGYKQGGRWLRQNVKLEYSPTRQRFEYVERIFNKVAGTYSERSYDPQTGEIVFQKQGPITDQDLHGRRARGT
jgi:hypothetical protein